MTAYFTSQLLTTDDSPGLGKISRMRDVYFAIYQKGGGEEREVTSTIGRKIINTK